MEEWDKENLITPIAKMKPKKKKNQLCLVLSVCPQHLFFHPQLSLLSAISLSRRLISPLLPINTLILCFLHQLHVTKLIRSHCQPMQPRTTSKQIEQRSQRD